MKRILFFCIGLVLLLFAVTNSLSAGGAQAESSSATSSNIIRIGAILPVSGGSALFGEYQTDGYRLVLDRINKGGGILGKQVELVIADSTGTADTGVSEFERLVNDPTICAITGPYNSGVAAALSPLAIKYKMPFLVTNAVADQTLSENSRYVFRANHGDLDCYNHYINALKYFGEVRGKPLTRIAIVFENTDFGKGTSDVFARAVNAIGATVVMNESFQSESSDLSSVVTKIKQLNPDLVLPAMYLNDALLFTRQMMEYDCNVPIVAQGGGFLAVDFPQKAGKKLSQYLIVGSGWFPDVIDAAKTQEAKDIRAAYIKSSGHDMNEAVSFGWLGMYVLLDAIQRAGSTDREAIAQALDATDLPADHPALMFHAYGGVKFGDDGKRFNQNIYAAFMFAQMFDGQFKMVYPPEMIVDKNPIVFPPPNWNKR